MVSILQSFIPHKIINAHIFYFQSQQYPLEFNHTLFHFSSLYMAEFLSHSCQYISRFITNLCFLSENIILAILHDHFAIMRQNRNLDNVIDCLQQQQRVAPPRVQGQDIEQIHNVTIDLLDRFNDHINRCKKYNEARIHRKYENTILLLEQHNESLRRKLELEREAHPSSQAYVSDLINRMVELRANNDRLRRENESLQEKLALYECKAEPAKKWESGAAQLCEMNNESMLIRDAIAKYTRPRKKEKMQGREDSSSLQRFFEFNSSKGSKWTLSELFQRLQKWMANLKDPRFLDSQRIRQKLERTCSSIDNEKTERQESSLIRLRTENMGSFVNERFTILSRRRHGKALESSLVRKQAGTTVSRMKGERR